ncbi:MAG: hypothetical protein J5610_01370 [Prevotella sp.]|nr:hypothetical protein [Prevotella sp.]
MAKHPLWSDEYWLLLMQLYRKRPAGLKPLYYRGLVDLALELHIRPQFLHQQMFRLRQLDSPKLEQLWNKYSKNPQKLSRGVRLLRQMKGFGQANEFYDGVTIVESWERDFLPIDGRPELTPVKLIMVLDLYFRLTPITMVVETPEVKQLARKMKITPATVVEVMDVYKYCDPYINKNEVTSPELLPSCKEIWERYGEDPDKVAAEAAQLLAYF